MITLDIAEYATPLGAATAAILDGRLVALTFSERWKEMDARLTRRFGTFNRRHGGSLQRRLDAYFAGDVTAFDQLEVDPGGTAFQAAVWSRLRHIPAGSTTTYRALALAIGSAKAVRAVGAANGANPIWLVIPCHRAIGSDGSLTGYAGGIERKRWLLEHERLSAPARTQSAIQLP
jgi:methylated-DNA-[protein]-cysteine S-methyltransferase